MPPAHASDEGPAQADPREVERLLALAALEQELPGRLGAISRALLGRPYLAGSLVGGPDQPERLVSRLDAFDCVTFCDAVYALATSSVPGDYPSRLQALRYHRGVLSWTNRNHYTHSWLERNVGARLLEPKLLALWQTIGPPRTLDILQGYPALAWQPRYLPWSRRASLEACVSTGDWVGFISRRAQLDTFHVGLLVAGDRLAVRHASQSRGEVIEEPLDVCMKDWDVPGLLLARPISPR